MGAYTINQGFSVRGYFNFKSYVSNAATSGASSNSSTHRAHDTVTSTAMAGARCSCRRAMKSGKSSLARRARVMTVGIGD